MLFRRLSRAHILVVAACVAAALVAFGFLRQPILRAIGLALVVTEPLTPVDIIVVSLDSGGAGALEAADLVRKGIAKKVAVFLDPPSGEDHEFIRRGLPYEDAGQRQIRQLKSLGVNDIVRIPIAGAGTDDEAQALPQWSEEHQVRTVVFVATKDHSRRAQRVMRRAQKGHPVRIMVQAASYSNFDPDRWWQTRGGVRTEIIELQKLLLDFLLHPLPA
jgi:uncharacterized SAM-binding protein YcdF (DUF218 family)